MGRRPITLFPLSPTLHIWWWPGTPGAASAFCRKLGAGQGTRRGAKPQSTQGLCPTQVACRLRGPRQQQKASSWNYPRLGNRQPYPDAVLTQVAS